MTDRRLNPNHPFFHEERHQALAGIADRPVTVCGAGALGGSLTETLARMGFSRLTVIDRDRVATRNLSTQPYLQGEVGAPKARALANTLYRAVGARINPVATELAAANAETLLAGATLIVDAFDNRAARLAVSETANRLALACLHIGFSPDGLYGSGLWEPGYRVPRNAGDDPCDYPLTRPLAVMLAALAARTIVDFLVTGDRLDFELTWRDLAIRQLPGSDRPSSCGDD